MKKISILLPYKENFSPKYAGAVSLLVKDTSLKSKYKKNITVYGFTGFQEKFKVPYKNIKFNKRLFESSNIKYAEQFLKEENKSDLIEIHNRPAVFHYILSQQPDRKIVVYFHNDPLSLRGSSSVKDRTNIFNKSKAIIFVSEWTKSRFFENLECNKNNPKVSVIYPSVNKKKFNNKKEKIILFVGKLNPSKGFDLFCKVVVKILDRHRDWKGLVIGDEPRAKVDIFHPRLIRLGFLPHTEVLKLYDKASIAIGCSKWNEPMGRIGLESSSRGCATIVSNKGGLPETITDGIILNELSEKHLFEVLDKLVKDKTYRKKLGYLSYKNFKKNLDLSSKQIDNIRQNILSETNLNGFNVKKNRTLRVMHVTNFAERHDGRLYFVSVGQKISNGLIRSGHSVLNYSDRDMMRIGRSYSDIVGKKSLNAKLIAAVKNYNPHLLLFGHADLIHISTLEYLKRCNEYHKG